MKSKNNNELENEIEVTGDILAKEEGEKLGCQKSDMIIEDKSVTLDELKTELDFMQYRTYKGLRTQQEKDMEIIYKRFNEMENKLNEILEAIE